MDLITIVPNPGQMKFIAQDLLLVADHPSQVAYVSRPQPGFQVSEELFNRFVALQEKALADESAPVSDEEPKTETEPTPAPKRGRPKKNVEAN